MENVVILKRGTVLKNPPSVEDCKPSSPAEKTPPIGGRAPGRSTDRQGSGSEIPQKHAPSSIGSPSLRGFRFRHISGPEFSPSSDVFLCGEGSCQQCRSGHKSIRFLLRLDLA
ncbi:unnamed protein product [Spirodela intermedia]|uniref:Uncharacterized protein n=1 Tax=Spirodela intermedia TaxID=51605 RepID=A0A7I8JN02_SPIIN|nr:unnamed protein product [Spirodela intermedia]CAA6670963.1 unnamed protein product [Spirodela intermedia]